MMKKVLLISLTSVSLAAIVWAGCKSDCQDEYQSDVETCHLLNDDPDDSDDLALCIQSAKDDYESCVEECDN
jgi:hypothetical protein